MRYVLLILCKIANQINKAKSLDTPYPAAAFLATWLAVLCSSISTGHVDESALCMDNKCSACQISRGWSCTANYHGWSTSLSKTMFAACSALLRILAGLRAARRRWSCSHAGFTLRICHRERRYDGVFSYLNRAIGRLGSHWPIFASS